ncbi:MAG: DNA repair protein RecN (Recombination protein N) [Candidatus Krumholzibacteriia bacterium]|jgi:DNA repair protein RecN (Recombination protein N)
MLTELRVGNLALVEDLNLQLNPGLTMLTGETGAGKSLIAGALSLLTGVKADRGLIRAGEEMAWVEGVFDLADRPQMRAWLVALGVCLAADEILVLRRELRLTGRGRVLINGLLSSLTLLEQVGSRLLSIQSQDQQRKLGQASFAQNFLDNVLQLNPELAAVKLAREAWDALHLDLINRRQEAEFARQQVDMWQYQLRELQGMGLDAEEEENLAEQLAFGRNARSLLEAASKSLAHLSEGQVTARQLLGSASGALASVASTSQRLDAILDQIQEAERTVGEAGQDLERFLDAAEVDPAKLDEMEGRKAQYEELRRKYGLDVLGLISLQDSLADRLGRQSEAVQDIDALVNAVAEAETALVAAALDLRQKRIEGAPSVAERAAEAIRPLALPEISLAFEFSPRIDAQSNFVIEGEASQITNTGADNVALSAQTNRGEKAGEVALIASGGEKSRIFLGLSVLADQSNEQPLLLFDEIDAGLGMDNAIPVAALLADLAKRGQVLCITHLATVAARGDSHLKAEKSLSNERTTLSVDALTGPARLEEIARLLGADSSGEKAAANSRLAYAKQLLAQG